MIIFNLKKFRIINASYIFLCDDIKTIKKIKADIYFFTGSYIKINKKKSIFFNFEEGYTLFSNLSLSENELLQKVKKNTQYEIRRAMRDNFIYKIYNSYDLLNDNSILDNFSRDYAEMWKNKNSNKKIDKNYVNELIKNNCFFLSVAFCEEVPVIYHAYIENEQIIRLLYSISNFRNENLSADRNLIARFNRALHWVDICDFKKNGYITYDWGGINEKDHYNISQFKLDFGGEKIYSNNGYLAKSFKSKLAILAKSIIGIFKRPVS